MSHSHNHRAPLKPPFWRHNTAALQSKLPLIQTIAIHYTPRMKMLNMYSLCFLSQTPAPLEHNLFRLAKSANVHFSD